MTQFIRPSREPDLEAEISARPPSEGGRQSPMYSGYRPNHNFGVEGMLNDAIHEYPETGSIAPGEKGKANLWLVAPKCQEGRLFIGMAFTVQEGGRIVGMGRVTKVINESLQKKQLTDED